MKPLRTGPTERLSKANLGREEWPQARGNSSLKAEGRQPRCPVMFHPEETPLAGQDQSATQPSDQRIGSGKDGKGWGCACRVRINLNPAGLARHRLRRLWSRQDARVRDDD